MPSYNPIVDAILSPEGKPGSITITSHGGGQQQPDPTPAAPRVAVSTTSSVAVPHDKDNFSPAGLETKAFSTNTETVKSLV